MSSGEVEGEVEGWSSRRSSLQFWAFLDAVVWRDDK